MRFAAIPVLFSALLCAQPPAVPKVAPGTPAPPAQITAPPPAAAPASVPPETVVLTVDGRKVTAGEVDKIIENLPAQAQQAARMQPQFLSQYFMFQRLKEDAEKEGLDKQSPYKEQIEFNRLQVLGNAELTTYSNSIKITPEEQEKYYKANPEKYQEAKVRVIYITFNPAPDKTGAEGKKLLTEAEAKAKVDDLRKQILNGADFGKMARENSEDKVSAGKDGDFGIIKHNSPYPQPVKDAVFALKPGGISEPVKQPNGFYLIKLDEFTTQPFQEVSMDIFQQMRQERFNEHIRSLQTQYTVKVENQGYFTPKAAGPQLQPVR